MRTPKHSALSAFRLGASLLLLVAATPLAAAPRGPEPGTLATLWSPIRDLFRDAPAPAAVDHIVTISSDSRVLTFKLTGNGHVELALTGGRVLVDGTQVGR